MHESTASPQTERVHCNKCGGKTKHEVLIRRKQEGSEPYDEDISIWWMTIYTLYECCGCESVCLKKEFHFSEWDPGTAQVEFFPPPIARNFPEWSHRLPNEENELLVEVYRAIAADSRRVALMGARAVVDMFIVRQVGDEGGFDQKLRSLESKGFLSAQSREILSAALDAGSASAHRGFRPSGDELAAVMDIIENLLHASLLQEEARELRKSVPGRKQAKVQKPRLAAEKKV